MLEEIISQRGYTLESFATELGISEKLLKNKLKRTSEFRVKDVIKITFLLKLNYNEVSIIFFK